MITPTDVLDYTAFNAVKSRSTAQLEFDIIQASKDIYKYVGHKFDDLSLYSPLPSEVKLAFIKLAEYYALINSDESLAKGIKSEKIGDYQYTLSDGNTESFSLSSLLDDYVSSTGKKGLTFKMRAL